jgi:hypothetical protein
MNAVCAGTSLREAGRASSIAKLANIPDNGMQFCVGSEGIPAYWVSLGLMAEPEDSTTELRIRMLTK